MTNGGKDRPMRRKKYIPAVGPRLKKLLFVVFGLFAVICVNSAYLIAITCFEWLTGEVYQNWFYLLMFLLHLILGLLLVLPVLLFGIAHLRNAYRRPNRRAVRVGLGLFATVLVLLASGFVLMRLEGLFVVRDPLVRGFAYWAHVLSPPAAVWLFVLHRLAGRRIRWKIGLRWAAVAAGFAVLMLAFQAQDPRKWNVAGNPKGEHYFQPSLARTVSGNFISSGVLQNDAYCQECHADIHETWMGSVHKFSSFNNPPYLFSVRETREAALKRDGTIQASRWCAGCHDPVPFFSGRFDDPEFDDVNDPTAHAGITCTMCHSITHINSVRGNADYTIDEPIHYPFAFSEQPLLRWTNRQLIKAKPAFHQKTFLKPLHQSTEFCGSCHKVHLPFELNRYKWLRGQNHYDSFLLSGVSGIGVSSFYYPKQAEENCNNCHMPLIESDDFGARYRDDSGLLKVHNHMFPSANTAIPMLVAMKNADQVVSSHQSFLQGIARVDLFGIKEEGLIGGPLIAPIRPEVPALEPGKKYLFETVVRTLKLGHHFTQGTADSNQIWLDVTVSSGNRIVGRSGGLGPHRKVDPWSHFVNIYMLDRAGNRIDRRNAQDIFVPLYNNQIPPGAADTVHFLLRIPSGLTAPIRVEVKLQYRKFDTPYLQHVYGDDFVNDLPITTLAQDSVLFPVKGQSAVPRNGTVPIDEWERWNDYGIGLLLKGQQGQLRQAERAFRKVEELGRPDGPINLARVYIREGLVQTHAPEALARAEAFAGLRARQWSLLWFSGIVDQQNGNYEAAIADFQELIRGGFEQARGRDFDFSRDYRLLNQLARTLYLRSLQLPRDSGRRQEYLDQAVGWFKRVLELDPENLTAHWGLKQIYRMMGDQERESIHASLHAKYKPDDNARDHAIAVARKNDPAADHAAEAVVIYDLQRTGAFELRADDDRGVPGR